MTNMPPSVAVQQFIPLVTFLGTFLGKDCEVVLHDISRPDKSVVAIANSHISGRRVGSPITDMALQLIQAGVWKQKSFITRYKTQTRNGHPLYSATYFICEDGDILAGMLCLNMDTSSLLQAQALIERTIQRGRLEEPRPEQEHSSMLETFAESLEDLTTSITRQVITSNPISPERMTPEEKMAIVRTLHDKGVFLLKGAVADVARHLFTSEATIYRYLQRISG